MTDWTTPRTWVIGEKVTKLLLDVQIRDNMNHLKEQITLGGGVIGLSPESAIFPISGITAAGLQQYESSASNPKINELRLSFVSTSDTWAMWKRVCRGAIGTSPYLRINGYMATATSGNIGFGVRLAARSDGDTGMTSKAFATANTGHEAVPGTAGTKFVLDIPLTNLDSLTSGDEVNIGLYRNTAVASNASGICYVTYAELAYGA